MTYEEITCEDFYLPLNPNCTTTTTTTSIITTTTTTIFTPFFVNFGLLYNSFAFYNINNISSNDNWHVPTEVEWYAFRNSIGGSLSGGKLKTIGTQYWTTPNTGATNELKLNFNGSGVRYTMGNFDGLTLLGGLWVKMLPNGLRHVGVMYNSTSYFGNPYGAETRAGASLRLLNNSTLLSDGEEGLYTGNDGKIYRTICIGTQEWLADNLCETKYRDGSSIPEVADDNSWKNLTTGAFCYYNNDPLNM